MTTVSEVRVLEEQLRQAELDCDAAFFERALADDAVLVSETGDPFQAKTRVVEAHRPGVHPGFTRVDMSEQRLIDHGDAVVVTCRGTFGNADGEVTLKFMRVWLKRHGRWQIIAGSVSKA